MLRGFGELTCARGRTRSLRSYAHNPADMQKRRAPTSLLQIHRMCGLSTAICVLVALVWACALVSLWSSMMNVFLFFEEQGSHSSTHAEEAQLRESNFVFLRRTVARAAHAAMLMVASTGVEMPAQALFTASLSVAKAAAATGMVVEKVIESAAVLFITALDTLIVCVGHAAAAAAGLAAAGARVSAHIAKTMLYRLAVVISDMAAAAERLLRPIAQEGMVEGGRLAACAANTRTEGNSAQEWAPQDTGIGHGVKHMDKVGTAVLSAQTGESLEKAHGLRSVGQRLAEGDIRGNVHCVKSVRLLLDGLLAAYTTAVKFN